MRLSLPIDLNWAAGGSKPKEPLVKPPPGCAVIEAPGMDEVHDNLADAWELFGNRMNSLSPITLLNNHAKGQLVGALKSNWVGITRVIIEASLYCTAFHHVKEGLKRITRKRRRVGPAVRYTLDVMIPTPLYGPIFGLLLRLALPF